MRLSTCQLSENEREMREWVFVYNATDHEIVFTRYRVNARSDEQAPWDQIHFWQINDVRGVSDLDETPEVPQWVEDEIEKQFVAKLTFS